MNENERMNLEAGWYARKNEDDPREKIIRANNPNPYRDAADDKIKEYIEDLEKLQRVAKNTKEHGPVLANFIEESREREVKEVKENVKKEMEHGMLSEEEEKIIRDKIGVPKKEYETPECGEVDNISTGEDEPMIPVQLVKENSFTDIVWKLNDLHERKNHDYGNAAHESYKEFGLISYIIRLNDKMKRLKSLTKPGAEQQVKEESIVDTLMDLAAYSIMAIESLKSDE